MRMIQAHHRLLVFNSVHRVMVAEGKLKEKFDVLLIPVPADISADCGMVLRFSDVDEDAILQTLCQLKLEPFSIYAPQADGFAQVGDFS
ncbi:MAG: DUF3343 domain-containing protein [Desulfuromonadaceae bacterium]|nr:DUF3343 domain-containing protein [Desulfuromonas sp.]MDY0184504.1 DUF3343 domain-containing protein [Desulfuromonadaceae bacterium]